MNSKFKLKAFFPFLCLPILIFALSQHVYIILDETTSTPKLNELPAILFFTFTLLWLFFGEIRTKMSKIVLYDDHLIINHFGGLLISKKYLYKDVEGFKTSILHSRGDDIEALYFIKNNKKIGKISDYYHKNYSELKSVITSKLEDLGYEKFSYIDELKEIFS